MRGCDFIFECVHLLYYKCHKLNQNLSVSYKDSPDSINSKRAKINHINKKNNKCFQDAATVALNHEDIAKHSERMTKVKPLINKYKLEEKKFPSEKDDWKKW